MARFSLPLLLLACTAGKDSGADCVSDDPCDCGVAWTERRGPVATVQDAVNGAQSGETVYLCEGEIKGTTYFPSDSYETQESTAEIRVVGAGLSKTTLAPSDGDTGVPTIVLGVGLAVVTFADLTITGGQGSVYTIDDFYNRATFGGALHLCAATVVFDDVVISGNEANLGGGFSTWCVGNTGLTDITLIDSFGTDNSGRGGDERYSGGGGAWLADDFILTSVNTDWGSGDTDNRDDDIAIGPFGGPYTSYTDFGAAENFVCTSEAQACTRTE